MEAKPVLSWLAVLGAAAAVIKVYFPELFERLARNIRNMIATNQPANAAAEPLAKGQKTKRTVANRLETSTGGISTPTLSATEGKSNKKRKLISPPVEKKVVAQTTEGQKVTLPRDEDDEMSNKEFAQQFARAQAGTKLEPAQSRGPSKKERRAVAKQSQGKPNGLEASEFSTETSSATGRDGEDDLSPSGSPSTGAVSTAPTSRAGDVSDMLEAPVAKPGILRLTDVTGGGSKQAPKSSQAFQAALTKKQRQRQAKAAEQKSFREEADRMHEQKKQAQLRTARMAEGSSNQTKANSFTSKQNAWQSQKPAAEELALSTNNAKAAPLLDTFDKTDESVSTTHGAVTLEPLSDVTNAVPETANVNAVRNEVGEQKTTALGASEREKVSRPGLESQASWADQVNEEEQNTWASELAQEEKWESVTGKKGKKKTKNTNGDTSSEASFTLPKSTGNGKPADNGTRSNGVKQPRTENVNRFQSIEAPVGSSFKDAEWEA